MALQEGFVKTLVDATRDWVKDYVDEHGGGGGQHTKEQVSIHLSTNDGGVASFHGMTITVKNANTGVVIDTEEADEVGMAVFYIPLNVTYNIVFPSIEGYFAIEDLTFTSEHYVRDVPVTYKAQYNDVRDIARGFVVEATSSPSCALNGNSDVVDDILGHGAFVIDEYHKKYAKLDENDHTKFADGTAYSGSYGNVFRYLPKVYLLKNALDVGTRFYVSEKPISDICLPESWIGVYKGSMDSSNRLRSIPNVITKETATMTDFWNMAQRVGTNYGLVNYFDHQKLVALHAAKFGTLNSETTMGKGLQNAGSGYYSHVTGYTATLGNRTGEMTYGTTSYKMCKLFGIEDLAGATWEFRPNIRFDGSQAIIYEGNIISNTAVGIRSFVRNTNLSQSYIKKMALGDYFDVVPTEGGGSSETYWCDGSWAASNGQLLAVGGYSADGSIAGLAAASSFNAFSVSTAYYGSRLAFKGNIAEYELVSGTALADLQ